MLSRPAVDTIRETLQAPGRLAQRMCVRTYQLLLVFCWDLLFGPLLFAPMRSALHCALFADPLRCLCPGYWRYSGARALFFLCSEESFFWSARAW